MAISARMASANARQGISSPSSSSSGGSTGQAYTFQSNGQSFTATPNANITAGQASAVANNSAFTRVGSTPSTNVIGGETLGAVDPMNTKLNFGSFESLLNPANYTGITNSLSTNNPDGTPKSVDTQLSDAQSNASNNQFSLLMKQMTEPLPSSADAFKKAQNETGILQKQQLVGDLTGQLNQIVATSQAQQLQVTGQGRGIPEAVIGGQQAQIAKEAAIQSLPVAAQLSAAQGNLEMAQSNLNTLFKIYSDDATNAYNRKNKMYDAFSAIVGKADQNKIDALQKQSDRAYTEGEANRKASQEMIINAFSQGAPTSATTKALDAVKKGEGSMAVAKTLGVYAGDFLGNEAKRASTAASNASAANSRASAAKTNAEAKAAKDAKEKGLLSESQSKLATSLREERNGLAEVKNAKSLEADATSLLSSLKQKTGVGDIAAINSFQRLAVDPGVAVREGDVSLLQSAQSYGDRAWLKSNGLMKGDKLTETARKQMEDVTYKVYEARRAYVEENLQPIKTIAAENSIDYNKYIGKEFSSIDSIKTRVDASFNPTTGVAPSGNTWNVESPLGKIFNGMGTTQSGISFTIIP